MKTIQLISILVFIHLISSCTGKENKHQPIQAQSTVEQDVLPEFGIDTLISGVKLQVSVPDSNSIIVVNYNFIQENKIRTVKLKHNDYSEVVFPSISIALVQQQQVSQHQFYITRDSLLILPLIGLFNRLQVYFINLKTGKEILSDTRTFLHHVWLLNNDKENVQMITCNLPEEDLNGNNLVVMNKYVIRQDQIKLLQERQLKLEDDIRDLQLAKQWELIQKLFK